MQKNEYEAIMTDLLNSLSIDEVSRDTGLGKDTLRVWERRYGFPRPERGTRGERRYPLPQMERLRVIRRLMDQGYRPGRILTLDENALQALSAHDDESKYAEADKVIAPLIKLDHQQLEKTLRQYATQLTSQQLSLQIVSPLLSWIGKQWALGKIQIHEEHAVTQLLQNVLIEAVMKRTAVSDWKRAILTTVPGEKHILGLLIIELAMREQGWLTVNLGPETPVGEILRASEKHRSSVIAISFNATQPRSRILSALQFLNDQCPDSIHILAGGQSVSKLRRLPSRINVLKRKDDLNKMLKKVEAKIV